MLARLPASLPLNTAGGIPLVALTAWQALHEGSPRPGKRVLVHAAAGGVGHFAVQIAKALGMYVVSWPASQLAVKNELCTLCVCSPTNEEATILLGDPDFGSYYVPL